MSGHNDDTRTLSIMGHLEELRTRLLRSFLALILGTFIGWFLSPMALEILTAPIEQAGIVSREVNIARVVVGADGTWRFTNWAELQAASVRRADADGSPTLQLTALEFFAEGAPNRPVASWTPPQRAGFLYLKPTDPLAIRFKAAVVLGLLFALPVVLYEIYAFIRPGLLPHEKRWVLPTYLSAILLFPAGAVFAYWLMRFALLFFAQYATGDTLLLNDMRAYLGFALFTILAFGIVFELPLLVVLLTRFGVVRVETLARHRKHIFVFLMVISAVATPTGDPFTLMAMTLPLYGLFEIAMMVSRWVDREAAKAEERLAHGQTTED